MERNTRHAAFIDSVTQLKPLERDEAFREAAIKNIKHHPKKYVSNWIANVGRLLFSYPYSYKSQYIYTFWTLVPNMFIVVILVLLVPLSVVYYNRFPKGILLLLLFFLVYLFGSTLVSAFRRMFYVTLPFWFLFVSFTLSHIVELRIRKRPADTGE